MGPQELADTSVPDIFFGFRPRKPTYAAAYLKAQNLRWWEPWALAPEPLPLSAGLAEGGESDSGLVFSFSRRFGGPSCEPRVVSASSGYSSSFSSNIFLFFFGGVSFTALAQPAGGVLGSLAAAPPASPTPASSGLSLSQTMTRGGVPGAASTPGLSPDGKLPSAGGGAAGGGSAGAPSAGGGAAEAPSAGSEEAGAVSASPGSG